MYQDCLEFTNLTYYIENNYSNLFLGESQEIFDAR
jgi:hypothetical protein